MTKEEAQIYIRDLLAGHHEECTTNHYWDVARGVDKIFDDFESRTCEHCIYHNNLCTYQESIKVYCKVTKGEKYIPDFKDFGCNEFVSTDTKGEEDGK